MNRVTSNRSRTHSSESGMAMVTVIVLLAALLAVGAISLSMQLNSTKSARYTKNSRASLFCAEAGLAAARNVLVANTDLWNVILDPGQANPVWYPITGDLDGDGNPDYSVTIRDDGDLDNDPTTDDDATIVVVSTCTQFADSPAQVLEIISLGSGGYTYRNQSGQGPGNTGNAN